MIVDLARRMRSSGPAPREDEPPAGALFGDDVSGSSPVGQGRTGFDDLPTIQRTPEALTRARLIRFLERLTGQRLGPDLTAWREWMWRRPPNPHPDLLAFKARLYGAIDSRMAVFFRPGTSATIRMRTASENSSTNPSQISFSGRPRTAASVGFQYR